MYLVTWGVFIVRLYDHRVAVLEFLRKIVLFLLGVAVHQVHRGGWVEGHTGRGILPAAHGLTCGANGGFFRHAVVRNK